MKFAVTQDDDNSSRWTAISPNGNKTAWATGYNTKSGARKAARNFVKAVQKMGDIVWDA